MLRLTLAVSVSARLTLTLTLPPGGCYSLEGLILGADVEADLAPFDGEGVHGVVLHHHLGVLRRSQLDKCLQGQTDPGSAQASAAGAR